MVGKAFFLVTGISAVLLSAAPGASAQQLAPKVHVISQPFRGQGTIAPSISLSEPAYLLAVAIDRDGQVSVLSPVGPNDLIKFEASQALRLPEFFAGFSTASSAYWDGDIHYASYMRSATENYSVGSVLVLASRTPFNFAAISDGAFWDEDAIKSLVRYRDPANAVYTLGRAVTAKGQSFGHDYLRFDAPRYRIASADPCFGMGYAFGAAAYGYAGYPSLGGYSPFNAFGSRGFVILAPTRSAAGLQLISIGTDACGRMRYVVAPIRPLPPEEALPDSAKAPKQPVKSVIAATAPGNYTGDAAVRVYEMLKNHNNSDTYVGVPISPILQEKQDGPLGRPVTRDAAPPERVESFERVRSANPIPIERAPILRQATPQLERPKPAEVTSAVKDNQ